MSKAQAAEAMRMHQRQGISLKAAWAKVKGGRMSKKSGKRSGKRSGGKRRGGYYNRTAAKARGIFDGIMSTGGTIPVTKAYLVAGAVAEVTGWLPSQRAALFAALTRMLQGAGINYQVNGYNLGMVLVAAKAVASVWPWFGIKLNALLSGFGLRI